MSINRLNRLAFARLILQETGTYNPLFLRPYETHLDGHTVNNIVNRITDNGGGRITGALLSGVATDWMHPSATPGNIIDIPNGWMERRIRFLLEAHVEFTAGANIVYYLQGYTNFPGVSPTGNIAPEMEFIVNSIIGVSRVEILTPMGFQTRDRITESSQVMADPTWSLYSSGHTKYTMRPQDIFTGLHSQYLENSYSVRDSREFSDARNILRRDPIRSSRSNNIASNFVTKVIDAHNTGSQLAQMGQSELDIISNARQQIYEYNISENPVIRALSDAKATGGIVNRFTFSDFQRVDPNIANVTNYAAPGPVQMAQFHQAGQTEHWNGSDHLTLAATILSQSVPAVMMDLMINRIVFRSTNHDFGGMMNTIIIDAKSMINADLTQHFELFRTRLEREILLDVTFNNQEQYMLDMTVDMFGETVINISLGASPMTTFVVPSFCDNLYSPVISGNKEAYNRVISDFEQLINTTTDAVNSTSSYQINPSI